MFVSNPTSNRGSVPACLFALLLTGMLAISSFAQDAAPPQNTAPAPPSAPDSSAAPQTATAGDTAAPQGRGGADAAAAGAAPQRNAHPYSEHDYTRGRWQWPNPFIIYAPRTVGPLRVQNSRGSDQIIRDGKIYLSMDDAVALALENNLDIGIQRYNLWIADTDILRTSSGAVALGVNAGLLQGTPGGKRARRRRAAREPRPPAPPAAVWVARRSVWAEPARARPAWLPPPRAKDRRSTATIRSSPARYKSGTRLLRSRIRSFSGTNELYANTTTANFAYTEGFPTGTLLTVGFDNTRLWQSSLNNTINPTLTPSFTFQVRQHLLQGFGYDPNLRYLRIARNNKLITEITFRDQLITTVSQIENIYWDLVNAYENVTVQQRALDLANKTLSDNQKQVTQGTLAPLTVVQSQSAVATAKQNLIAAQVALQLEQLLMKNAVTRNMADPILAVAPVIPTDTLNTTSEYEIGTVDELIAQAMRERPEIATARLTLTNNIITKKSLRNELLPTLDLYAFYGATALAGPGNNLCNRPHSLCLAWIPDQLRRRLRQPVQRQRSG